MKKSHSTNKKYTLNLYPFILLSFLFLIPSCKKMKKGPDIQGAVVTEFRGTVTIQKKEDSYKINYGDLTTEKAILSDGAILETDSDSRADLHFTTGVSMRIGPKTKIKVEKAQVLTGENFSKVLLYLEKGSVFTESPKLSNHSSLMITSPTAAAMVRGTKFLVTEDNGKLKTVVLEGSVAVMQQKKRDAEKIVNQGMTSEASDAQITVLASAAEDTKVQGLNDSAIKSVSEEQQKALAEIFENSPEQKSLYEKTLTDFQNIKTGNSIPEEKTGEDESEIKDAVKEKKESTRIRDKEEFGRLKSEP